MGGPDTADETAARQAEFPSVESKTVVSPNGEPRPPPGLQSAVIEKPQLAHTLPAELVALQLGTDLEDGLSDDEAAVRLARDGPNTIQTAPAVSLWRVLFRQIANALTMVLIFVAALSLGIHDYAEGGAVVFVIILNIVVGLTQDYRAERTIQALYVLSTPRCKVIRDGHSQTIKAVTLVVGDVVSLVTGDIVPADLRLVKGTNIAMAEAPLTGESVDVTKTPEAVFDDAEMPIGDRTNIAFAGCSVSCGRATGIVVATGMETEVGRIAHMLRCGNDHDGRCDESFCARTTRSFYQGLRGILGLEGTPLQVTLSKFAFGLFGLAFLLVLIVFSIHNWRLSHDVLKYGVCVGVAVIPESLLAVVTVTMAVASKAMAKGHVIVRRMPCLEAVGGVTNICSDKTGTLTQGRMIVRRVWLRGGLKGSVEGSLDPYDPASGSISWSGSLKDSCLDVFLSTLAVCNHATVTDGKKEAETDSSSVMTAPQWQAVGEPTEVALRVFAMRFGRGGTPIKNSTAEFPFDSTRKLMSVVCGCSSDASRRVHTKGAVEVMLPLLDETEELLKAIHDEAESLAASGLRVLCIADRVMTEEGLDRARVEQRLHFLGLVGLYDPPRPESALAVKQCREAGISVHMLTGDHIKTASAVAREVGILSTDYPGDVMSASSFGRLSDNQIDRLEKLPAVIARCSPLTKVRVIQALHRRGAFCVMTGDGINDSPALKQADVGIAMGDRGSDVAKEASDMVLTDDNFASIVTGIREGRRLSDNIQKFLLHLLTSNLAQVILLLIALVFKDCNGACVFPLSPMEILWANLIMSSPLAVGLGLEAAQPDILNRPPRSLHRGVFTVDLVRDQLVYGVLMGGLSLGTFMLVTFTGAWSPDYNKLPCNCNHYQGPNCDIIFKGRGATFATLSLLLLIMALEVRSSHRSVLDSGPVWRNQVLGWGLVGGLAMIFPILYIPHLNTDLFRHRGLTWEWGIVMGSVATFVILVEVWKAGKRSRRGLDTPSRTGLSVKIASIPYALLVSALLLIMRVSAVAVGALLGELAAASSWLERRGGKDGKEDGGVRFEPGLQLVSTTGEHAFKAPGLYDLRGPCPGLNTLANHGYIPRDGIATIDQVSEACNDVYGIDKDFARQIAIVGAVAAGDSVRFSIGGPPHGEVNKTLGMKRKPTGLSNAHNVFEGDASPTRCDYYQCGGSAELNLTLFQQLYDEPIGANGYDISVVAKHFSKRLHDSIHQNPSFFYDPSQVSRLIPLPYIFIPRLFANHSAEFPEGHLNAESLKSFYGVSGQAGNLTYKAGHERIPNHWYRRHPLDEFTRSKYLRDLVEVGNRDEARFTILGGNTGTVDSFTALNISAVTRGVYSREKVSDKVIETCLPKRFHHELVKRRLSEYFEHPEKPFAVLAERDGLDKLGCPELKEGLDFSVLDEFPGSKVPP
ncbi:hypothetical protein CDD80_2263 [Ophiocordyceps camponoti-rufipedis]|uniref:P-type Na(+) transporter n=1 Tax=Ophiocordyceps camponoti-rufipedis TaxID=2004952 RepID=A0A2C5Z764_9HYPO|nr:hypothetical protein CDD80_2263 [Ophiocordyceps camponoti-rufipedis]